MKLRTKLLLWTVPIGILSLLIFEASSFYIARHELSHAIVHDNERVSQMLQSNVKQLLASIEGQFTLLGEYKPFRHYLKNKFYELSDEAALSQAEIGEILKTVQTQNHNIKAIAFLEGNGGVVASAGDFKFGPETWKQIEEDRVWSKGIRISHPIHDEKGEGSPSLRFSKAFNEGSTTPAKLVMEVYLTDLFGALGSELHSGRRVAYVLDESGHLFHATDHAFWDLLKRNEGFLSELGGKGGQIIDLPGENRAWITVSPQLVEGVSWNVGQIALRSVTFEIVQRIAVVGGILLLVAIAFKIGFLMFFSSQLTKPIDRISQMIRAIGENRQEDFRNLASVRPESCEIAQIVGSLKQMSEQLDHAQDFKVQEKLLAQASQLAHDIRAPVSALEMSLSSIPGVSDAHKKLVDTALGRIKGIARNLLDQGALQGGEVVIEPAPTRPQLIGAILDAIVTEKRGQYQNRDDLSIDLKTLPSSFSAFANVDPNELKRVLSNLIDNSAESIRGKGEITVGLSSQNDQVIIAVRDTGCGIAPEILARVGEKGFTHGKCGGHGLGVHHAKSAAKMWGGSLTIDSQLGKGTSATLTLPAASAPAWFVHEITLRSPETVVIVDDDPTMHELWKVRFAEVGHGVELRHFTSPDQFVSWVTTAEIDRLKTTFLVDYEFRGSKINGIELIESACIVDASILVTASFDAPEVQEGARRLWVKIIPKLIAAQVPIRLNVSAPGLAVIAPEATQDEIAG